VVPKEEEKNDVKFQFHNFTVDTMAMGLTEGQGLSSRRISPKAESAAHLKTSCQATSMSIFFWLLTITQTRTFSRACTES
jgi:hypothetical protein